MGCHFLWHLLHALLHQATDNLNGVWVPNAGGQAIRVE
jgi:hypothetical protein